MRHRQAYVVPLLALAFALLLAVAAQAQAQTPSFTRHDYAAGLAPGSLCLADVNGDGLPDAVVADPTAGAAKVLLNDGDGALTTAAVITAPSKPAAIAADDFDGDGSEDLAIVCPGLVRSLLGDGAGGFTSAGDFTVGASAAHLVSADFDGDGVPDLAVSEPSQNAVAVLLGEGDGTFDSPISCPTAARPNGLVADDFDGDGAMDLAVACSGGGCVSVLLGNGDGTFARHRDVAAGSAPVAVASADFTGDGNADLAVSGSTAGAVTLLDGRGDGTFSPNVPASLPAGPGDVAFGDLDGDNLPDLVVADAASPQVDVYLGHGDGSFAPSLSLTLGAPAQAVRLADMNDDDALDIVAAEPQTGTVSVLLNDGSAPKGTVALDDGRAATAAAGVTVDSHVTGAWQLRVRNEGGPWGDWQAYGDKTAWQLPAGDGAKTVDVEYRSQRGELLDLSSSIVLDTTAPATTDDAPLGWSSTDRAVTFTAVDAGSGVARTEYKLDDAAGWTRGGSVLVAGDGVHTVSYRSTDAAGNVEQAQQCTVRIDSHAPKTADDAPAGWLGATSLPLTVRLMPEAGAGSPVTCTQYRIDEASDWSDGAAVTVSTCGVHTIAYRSTDAAGNVERTRTCTVRIDTVAPATSGMAANAVPGGKAVFDVKVADAVPGDPPQKVAIRIYNARGKLVKTLSGFRQVRSNASVSLVWARCTLKRGFYKYVVDATDAARNRQSVAGGNRLVVR